METETVANWRVFDDWNLNPVQSAALELFVSKGYHGASMRQIAQLAGLSVPGLYHHIGSKEELLASLLFRGIREANARSAAAVAEVAGCGVEEQFRALVKSVSLYWTHRQNVTAIGREYRHLRPSLKDEYLLLRQQVYLALLGLVTEGSRSGVFDVDDDHRATRAVLLMARGAAEWFMPPDTSDPDTVANVYLVYALRIVGACRTHKTNTDGRHLDACS